MASLLRNITLLEKIPFKIYRPLLVKQPRRNLNVHEHISYTLLKDGGLPTPKFGVATSSQQAGEIAKSLNTNDLVVKAQVLAGGRGKGAFKNGFKGGVQMVNSPEEASQAADKMIGQLLVTKQTGEAGRICNSVMITEKKIPKKEYYMAIMMERAFQGPVIIASSQGGVNIEDVAAKNPDAIIYEPIDVFKGLSRDQAARVTKKIGLGDNKDMIENIINLYKLFQTKDATLIEVNPFAQDAAGKFFALDCKMRFDDNAAFRQKELFALRDWSQEDPKEVLASKFDLNYVALDGNIGCMVNGAGLAMATMDLIKYHGGNPANFLDVGGGATKQQVKEAFKIITSDPKVHAILVNIFGGIMRCDIIAEGIIDAAHELNIKVPIVARLLGNKVEEAKDLINKANLKLEMENDLDTAARKVVKFSKEKSNSKNECEK